MATVLKGSHRRAGNRVRVVAQLIDTSTDDHLWAETYDRDLTQIFEIQSDLAREIASALRYLTVHPDFDNLHPDPRHAALLRTMRLDEQE